MLHLIVSYMFFFNFILVWLVRLSLGFCLFIRGISLLKSGFMPRIFNASNVSGERRARHVWWI